jgi:hypothetical protein
MSLAREIPVPREPTEADVRKHRSIEKIEVRVSSELVEDVHAPKDPDHRVSVRPKVKKVVIKKEAELTPDLVMAGPTRRGELNVYILIDGSRVYFSAKTGEALGGELRPVQRELPAMRLLNLGIA